VRGVPLGVAVVVAGLYGLGLGAAPFLDPPEGLHAAVARSLALTGDWLTMHANGIPYFDTPPLLYWLTSTAFAVSGPTPLAARFWPALAGVGCAAVTAWIGARLGGPRLGLLAGLIVAANLGMFVYARIVKPDALFILFITLAFAGFAATYASGGRAGLVVFYASLGLATLAKDLLGAVGPLVVVAIFLWLTRERPLAPWTPWRGVGLLAAIVLPWYLGMEWHNRGFLWYTIVDHHALNLARQRVFPDEDVPLGALPFLAVTFMAFLPWALGLPWAVARAFRRPWDDATARLWLLFTLWPVALVAAFTLSPFKLPHHGLPAFPALALLAARVWDESIEAVPRSVQPRVLIVPILVLFAVVAVAFALVAARVLPVPEGALGNVDVATRNLAARGRMAGGSPLDAYVPVLVKGAIVFGAAACALAVAAWRRRPALGVGVALAAMIAFLPIAGDGMAQFARGRAARPIAEALARMVAPGDLVVHEGALENTASILLTLREPVRVVNGRQSNLRFGATSPEARDLFWDEARLLAAWAEPGRRFLVSSVDPRHSVVRLLPPERVHVLVDANGRRLYANLAD
jgi:4-amino-4-deoxy-L-arabinose transferase-like glycosyltransferase